MGTARRLAALDKWAFLDGLAERGIERHYGDQEFDEDIRYARNSGQSFFASYPLGEDRQTGSAA